MRRCLYVTQLPGSVKNLKTELLSCFSGVLRQLNDSRTQLEELWAARKLKLDLCLQLRLFERDAVEVSIIPQLWRSVGITKTYLCNSDPLNPIFIQ